MFHDFTENKLLLISINLKPLKPGFQLSKTMVDYGFQVFVKMKHGNDRTNNGH